ncbi:MAG: MarR family transcriptional regulator [Defluviimonas denitrificans]
MSRPAGLCFAAIWRAAQAPCADDLTGALGLSRSNVSTALKELRDWGLIARVRAPGDRKEYYTADPDAHAVLLAMLAAFQRRSLTPAVERLLAAESVANDARAAAMHSVLGALSDGLAEFAAQPPGDGVTTADKTRPRAARRRKRSGRRSAPYSVSGLHYQNSNLFRSNSVTCLPQRKPETL